METLEELSVIIPKQYALTNVWHSGPVSTRVHSLSISFHSCQQAADVLVSLTFPNVVQLSLNVTTGLSRPHEVKHLATTIANRFSRDALTSIKISAPLSNGRAWNWNKELAIQPSTLGPFLPFSRISRFQIEDASCSFDLDDAFLDEMANAWPCLIELVIGPSGVWPPTSRPTLASLSSFARHCKHIHTISYSMEGLASSNWDDVDEDYDSDNEDEDEGQEVASADCLQLLNIGSGRVTSIRRTAIFLSKVCPSLERISVGPLPFGDGNTIKKWNSVTKWTRTLAAARRDGQRRACRKLQSKIAM